ncbi:hypothetical protein FQR65_LT02607 [Abscondita terminalis]|nr:hypothetical protein FQR65_LT02607 [Abscondita terminalis]
MKIVVILVVCVSYTISTVPDYIKICPLNNEHYVDCVISSINHLKDYFKTGIKEINLPALEPLEINQFSFGSQTGNSFLATNTSNIKLNGVSTFNIIKLVHTPTKKGHTFRIEANIPTLHINGQYEINTRLVNVDLHGRGPFEVELNDYHFECMLKGRRTEVNNDVYLKFGTMQCNSVVGKISVYLHNLFGGNLALEKAANEAISQNSNSLLDEFRPGVADVVKIKLTELANSITMAYKYDELFPTDYIKVCKFNDEHLSDCIFSSVDMIRDRLKNGIEELNVPPLEPLFIDRLSFGNGKDQASRLATNLTNLKITGASEFKLIKVVPTLTKKGHTFRIEAIIPTLHIEGDYEINTKILSLELQGKGPFTANLNEYHFECMLKGKKVEKEGINHLEFAKMQCNVVIGKSSIYLHNLFGGNPILEKATNDAISENSESLYQDIRPGISDAIRQRFTDIANRITLSFTYEELFPES